MNACTECFDKSFWLAFSPEIQCNHKNHRPQLEHACCSLVFQWPWSAPRSVLPRGRRSLGTSFGPRLNVGTAPYIFRNRFSNFFSTFLLKKKYSHRSFTKYSWRRNSLKNQTPPPASTWLLKPQPIRSTNQTLAGRSRVLQRVSPPAVHERELEIICSKLYLDSYNFLLER